ncbi:hypothetical protein [Kistimonas asteriae]|uniref:hypothetical protein n=1 Tax=Kistimonas asteriae TaxID=517724 RepID=UPI001BA64387|nr:hypothetical protein [Kistimonas asteriae]
MGQSRSLDEEDNEALGWTDGQELKKRKSEVQRSKRKRSKSIHKGIEKYFEKKKLREELGDELEEDDLDFFDEDDDDWYQH